MQLDDIKDPIFITGRKILGILSEHGEAYIVGGAVRDLVMGNQIHDVDISTNVPMEVIEALFETHDIGKNKDFGIVVVNVDGVNFEIAQFRSDGSYTDGRRPDTVQLGVSFKEDTKRRDFTMNAMGLDLSGNIIDFHGGLEDIRCGRLKTVGKAFDRFDEDLLRILRAIRFAARFGYQLDEEIKEAIGKQKDRILTVSMERIRDELIKTIGYGGEIFAKALCMLRELGLLESILPEIGDVSEAIRSLQNSKTKDVVVVFSVLFRKFSPYKIAQMYSYLKLTSDEGKQLAYIGRYLNFGYDMMLSGSKQHALKMIQNEAFPKLQLTYAISETCQRPRHLLDADIAEIMEYVVVQEKQKQVNAILLTMGFKGKEFGDMQRTVNSWMYKQFEDNKTVKTNDEIKGFIQSNLDEIQMGISEQSE